MTENLKVAKFINKDLEILSCLQTDTVVKAKTLMLLNDYSQLPILNNEKIEGCVSWKSIGRMEVIDNSKKYVTDYLESPVIIKENENFLDYIKTIAQNDYVLVIDSKDKLTGIVTTYDMTLYFDDFITPYLKLGIIEDNLRKLIVKKTNHQNADNFDYHKYKKIFKKEENWLKIGFGNLDKDVFINKLDELRKIRNKVAHYKLTPLTIEEHSVIKSFAEIIEKI